MDGGGCGGDEVSHRVHGQGNDAHLRNADHWQHTGRLEAKMVCVYESRLRDACSEVVAEYSWWVEETTGVGWDSALFCRENWEMLDYLFVGVAE